MRIATLGPMTREVRNRKTKLALLSKKNTPATRELSSSSGSYYSYDNIRICLSSKKDSLYKEFVSNNNINCYNYQERDEQRRDRELPW